jgi:predicted PurR-regulated permease PerM
MPIAPTTTPTASVLNPRTQAGVMILLLGIAILIAVSPYAIGLLGVSVLYVLGLPMYQRILRVLAPPRAAVAVVLLILLFVIVPCGLILGLVLDQAPAMLRSVQNNAVFERLKYVHIGTLDVGTELSNSGNKIAEWASGQAFDFFGVAARTIINVLIALLGVYYMLLSGSGVWYKVKEYLPFSDAAAEVLRERFYSITQATFYGTILTSVVQGALVGVGLRIAGLPGALFWGFVAGFASILPLVGGALVWLPGTLVLLAQGQTKQALFLGVWGGLLVANIDNVVRAFVFKRMSNIHPLTTLIGAFAGLRYFGLLGVLVGPLAITYFFELLRIFDEEYGVVESVRRASLALRVSGAIGEVEEAKSTTR